MQRSIAALVAGCLVAAGLIAGVPASASPGSHTTDEVRVLNWNIWLGGTGAGQGNLPLLLDQVVSVAPDVFFAVETYGSGHEIRTVLTERAGKGEYYSAQISPGNGIYQDNLWIFTRFPIVQVYPKPTGGTISDFNVGGVRVRLPNQREVNLFDTWLTYDTPWIGDMIEQNAADVRAGRRPSYSARRIRDAERSGLAQMDAILGQLPAMLGGNTDPIILAGDLNTLPAADWDAGWAGCASHFGLSYALRTTQRLTGSGFTDSYRAANPDACATPGATWSPQLTMQTPDRIDFIFTKGPPIAIAGAFTIDDRLTSHPEGILLRPRRRGHRPAHQLTWADAVSVSDEPCGTHGAYAGRRARGNGVAGADRLGAAERVDGRYHGAADPWRRPFDRLRAGGTYRGRAGRFHRHDGDHHVGAAAALRSAAHRPAGTRRRQLHRRAGQCRRRDRRLDRTAGPAVGRTRAVGLAAGTPRVPGRRPAVPDQAGPALRVTGPAPHRSQHDSDNLERRVALRPQDGCGPMSFRVPRRLSLRRATRKEKCDEADGDHIRLG